MAKTGNIQPTGDKLKKALRWISEATQEGPDQKREDILREAETRFDLSPAECEFLDNNFS
ncbi:MAG: hypothetical protein KAS94_10130 [Desulfobulbaceae bacterium]|nr:hypothetical protein [Desulfobulbaceae bacterium]